MIVVLVDVHSTITGLTTTIKIRTTIEVKHKVPHHNRLAATHHSVVNQILHVRKQTSRKIAPVVPRPYAGFGKDNLLVRCLAVDIIQFRNTATIVVPGRTHHKVSAVHVWVERFKELNGIVLLVGNVIVVVVVVEAIYLRLDAGMSKGRSQLVDKSSLLFPWHIQTCTIAAVERLVLRSDSINGNTLLGKSLYEKNKVFCIRIIMVRVERTTRPGVIPHPVGKALHLHPLRTRPWRSHDLQVWIDGKYLLKNRNNILRLIRMQTKIFQTLFVTKRILCTREVRATYTDAGITDPVTFSPGICPRQECLTVGRCHLHKIVTGTIRNGITKAIHFLITLGRSEHKMPG